MSASAPLSDQDRRRILESLTQEDLRILQEAFTVYDKNHDGTITTKVDIYFLPCVDIFRHAACCTGTLHGDEVPGSEPHGCRGSGHH